MGMGGYGVVELGMGRCGILAISKDELTNWVDGCWIVSGDLRISIRLAG